LSLLWTLVLFTHIVAATFWVGGQLMLVFVMMPVMRRTARPELLAEMARLSWHRFAKVSNFGLFPVLVLTGILMAWHDGVRLHTIHTTSFGHVLEIKIVVVALVFGLAGAHGVAARRFSRRGVRSLAVVTMALSVVILGLAAALAILPAP
jgi:putative copper export protein